MQNPDVAKPNLRLTTQPLQWQKMFCLAFSPELRLTTGELLHGDFAATRSTPPIACRGVRPSEVAAFLAGGVPKTRRKKEIPNHPWDWQMDFPCTIVLKVLKPSKATVPPSQKVLGAVGFIYLQHPIAYKILQVCFFCGRVFSIVPADHLYVRGDTVIVIVMMPK